MKKHGFKIWAMTLALCSALFVSGCVTFGDKKGAEPEETTESAIVKLRQSDNDVIKEQIKLQSTRETTRQKEIDAQTTAMALMKLVADSPAATVIERVNAQTALLAMAFGRGGATAQPQITPQLTPQQPLPQKRDWLDRAGQLAGIVIPGGAPAILAPILSNRSDLRRIQAATDQAKIAADTTAAQWNAFAAAQGKAWDATSGIVGTLGRANVYNVGGDFAGGDLIGRYSGQGSGNSGQLLFGGGVFNWGDYRATSPGPYTVTCSNGTTGTVSASGQVSCPVQ